MIIAKELAGVESHTVGACQALTKALRQFFFQQNPDYIKNLIPSPFTFTPSSTREEPGLTSEQNWQVFSPEHKSDNVGYLLLRANCKTLKGCKSHAYLATLSFFYKGWTHKCKNQPLKDETSHVVPLNHAWLIAINEWCTDKFTSPTFTAELDTYIKTCTIPLLAPGAKPFTPPAAWIPAEKPVLSTIADQYPDSFPYEQLAGRQIERAAYSRDFSRCILFFTDKTQLVFSVHAWKQRLTLRHSVPDHIRNHPNPLIAKGVEEFDPFAL